VKNPINTTRSSILVEANKVTARANRGNWVNQVSVCFAETITQIHAGQQTISDWKDRPRSCLRNRAVVSKCKKLNAGLIKKP
jgi:hypothetical protein